LNEGSRLLSVFVAPGKLFVDLEERASRWWLPLVILVLVVAAAAIAVRLFIPPEVWIENIRNNIASSGVAANEEMLDMAMSRMQSPISILFTGLGGAIGQTAVSFLFALAFWAIFAIFGGKINFTKSVTVVTYTGLITALGIILVTVLSISLQRLDIQTSLALLPFLEPDTYLYRLAVQIDFFAIWRVLVMGLGFSVLGSVSRFKGYALVIIPWLILAVGMAFVRVGISR